MRKPYWGLVALVGTLALVLSLSGSARSQRPRVLEPLPQELAKATGLETEDAEKVLQALGPVITAQLASGRSVEVPGLGSFRVVRIPAHRDLVQGRPATIPPRNYVEFLPAAAMTDAANAPNAVPATQVTPFRYVPLPNRAPSVSVPNIRTPRIRVP